MKRLIAFSRGLGRRAAGLLLCSAIALLVAVFSAPRPWRAFVPLAFVSIILLLTARYGMAVCIFGSITAALIFAYFLYAPIGSFSVDNQAERSNLGWMILSGVALSYLLLPQARNKNRRP